MHRSARPPRKSKCRVPQHRACVWGQVRVCCGAPPLPPLSMDSLFEAIESVSDAVSAQLPDWLGDDPEEQDAHVHTRQARWEVLAAEVGVGEGFNGGTGDFHLRRPSNDDDDDAPFSPDALSESHQVYGVSSLPPRPLPADAEERAARLRASAAAAAAALRDRGSASPVAGSSTPTGSSWASRPPPGSPAARIECVCACFVKVQNQSRTDTRAPRVLPPHTGAPGCLPSSGMSSGESPCFAATVPPWKSRSFRKAHWSRTACTCAHSHTLCLLFCFVVHLTRTRAPCLLPPRSTLALAFPYVPPTLALATRVAHPWVQAAPVASPSASGDGTSVVRCLVSSPGLRAWDPATSTLGGVVRDVLSQLGATSRMTGEVVTLDRLDDEETPLDGGADGRHDAGHLFQRSEEEAEAADEWVPDELLDVAAALSDVAVLLGGDGDGGSDAMPDEATVLKHQKRVAEAALAKSMETTQPRGWSDDEPDEDGGEQGEDVDSSGEEQQQAPVRSPAPAPMPPMQSSPLRRPLIKPLTSPGSPGSVAALTAMLSSSPPPLAAQTRLEAVRVLESALLDVPSPSPSLPLPMPTPTKQAAPPPPLPPRRTQFLVPKRRKGDLSNVKTANVAMVETSDGGAGGESDGGATSAAGDVSSEDERQAVARPRAEGTPPAAGAPASTTRAAQLRDAGRSLVSTLAPVAAATAARSARRFARAASSRVSVTLASLALAWLLACATGASARASLPQAGMSACSLIAALPRDHPALVAASKDGQHVLSLVALPRNAAGDVARIWASPAGIAACSAHDDLAAGDAALGDEAHSLWASLSCGPPALVVATSRSWTQPLRVTATFSREGALVLGALTAKKGRLLTALRATQPTSCPAAVATSAWGLTRLAGATPAGLALLASAHTAKSGGSGGGTHVAAVLRAVAPSSALATWTGPLGGTLLCTASQLHTAAAAGASAETVDVLLRTLHATSSTRRGSLTPTLLRGLRCGPALLPGLYSETPLGAAARRRHGAIVDALSEALAASTAAKGARSSTAALGVGAVYGPWGVLTSQSPAALALMSAAHHQGGDTSPGQVLASLLTAHGGADGRLTRGGVALGPLSLLGHVTPLGLALLHGDAAAVASLLRLGAQHAQRGACASVLLIPSGITSCASLAALGDKSLPPLLAAWDEHVALEAADRMRVLMDVAIGGGSGGESASASFAQRGGEQVAPPPPRSREEVLLQAELEAQEEADLVLRVTASLARAKQTLASVGGSDTSPGGKGGELGAGDVTSVEALEATAAQLVNARRGAERAAAEVMAAAARLAAESAAEEASARRQAAQLAAYNARLSRQQARDMVAAEEEEEVEGEGVEVLFDAGDFDPDLGTQMAGLAVYDDNEL